VIVTVLGSSISQYVLRTEGGKDIGEQTRSNQIVSFQIIWHTFLHAIWRDPSGLACAPDRSSCDAKRLLSAHVNLATAKPKDSLQKLWPQEAEKHWKAAEARSTITKTKDHGFTGSDIQFHLFCHE
jgi:hypothetical protein